MYCGVGAYLLLANLVGYFLMWSDKRKAKLGKWRIPESNKACEVLYRNSCNFFYTDSDDCYDSSTLFVSV